LVKRGGKIGNGLYALPGGFLNNDERIYDGCVRELLEETQIDLTPPALKESVGLGAAREELTKSILRVGFRGAEVFDHPDRSQIGRLITHAHLFVIETPYLPAVKGADDAKEAFWWPLSRMGEIADRMHDDHTDIIQAMSRKIR
jgi:bifunctional NMN adenylyltransferase/nudix hydrolase